ncbi:gastrula zinc finger protein XlCGF66.1-like [Rhinophrynus dorsalis]
MTKGQNQMAERILNLTMEIIYLLTGENYIVVKKSGDPDTHSTSPWVPEGHCRTQSPIMEPPPVSLKHKRNNDQKILELTNEILHLLNREVPIRCEDVAVYFSLEEWEYLERHKEFYKEVKMVDHQPHSSVDPVGHPENTELVLPTVAISDFKVPRKKENTLYPLGLCESMARPVS